MRFVRTMMAVLPVLALSAQAQAQYGMYGAPSTLPLSQPQSQSTLPQNPPIYVDTHTANDAASSVVANPAPVYAQPAYANPAYANPVYANPGYAQPHPMQPQARPAAPGMLPAANRSQYDPGYATPIVPTAAYQASGKKLPPPPSRAPAQPGAPGPISQMLSEAEAVQSPAYDPVAGYGAECGDCYDPCCAPQLCELVWIRCRPLHGTQRAQSLVDELRNEQQSESVAYRCTHW